MNALQTEERTLGESTSLSWDIAKHMAYRLKYGQVVIVSKQPAALLASIRKQWLKVQRQVENSRARSLDATKIVSYTKDIAKMQAAEFSAKPPIENMWADIIIATAEEILEFVPSCATMYVATPTSKEILHRITSLMPEDGVVISYKLDK